MTMELIPINDSKLKIMLDEIDMKEYRLGAESDCADTETRRAIRDILDLARDRVGFNTEGAEIFVQLYTSKKGGCELFVTKGDGGCSCTQSENEADKINTYLPPKNDRPQSRSKKKESAKSTGGELALRSNSLPASKRHDIGRLAFSFASLDDLCRVCRILQDRGIATEGRAFCDDTGIFYLLLFNTGMSAYSRLDKFSFITEFGSKEGSEQLITYLGEYGKTICDGDAVELLGSF